MFGLSNHSRGPIGVDIVARRIKAIQLDRAGTRVIAATVVPRSEPGAVPSALEIVRLAAAMERAGFGGSRVVLAVPQEKLFNDVFELPRSAGASVEQMARLELARAHRCAPDSLEVGAWELPTSTRATKLVHVMAVACRHEDSELLLDAFERQGLEVVALDAHCCAAARSVSSLADDGLAVTGVLDFGWNTAALVLIFRDTVVYERKISESGLGRLHAEICQRLNVDAETADYLLSDVGLNDSADQPLPPEARTVLMAHLDTLVAELLASFQYAGHQCDDAPLGRLLLSGGGAAVPGMPQQLGNQLGVGVRAVAPADLFPCPRGIVEVCSSPTMAQALGLAMFASAAARVPVAKSRAA